MTDLAINSASSGLPFQEKTPYWGTNVVSDTLNMRDLLPVAYVDINFPIHMNKLYIFILYIDKYFLTLYNLNPSFIEFIYLSAIFI